MAVGNLNVIIIICKPSPNIFVLKCTLCLPLLSPCLSTTLFFPKSFPSIALSLVLFRVNRRLSHHLFFLSLSPPRSHFPPIRQVIGKFDFPSSRVEMVVSGITYCNSVCMSCCCRSSWIKIVHFWNDYIAAFSSLLKYIYFFFGLDLLFCSVGGSGRRNTWGRGMNSIHCSLSPITISIWAFLSVSKPPS